MREGMGLAGHGRGEGSAPDVDVHPDSIGLLKTRLWAVPRRRNKKGRIVEFSDYW
jgi:hypothetical protein